MPNEILNELDFETKIKGLTNRKLMEFNSRQLYDVCSTVVSHGNRLDKVEKKGNRIIGGAAAIGAGLGALVIAVINYFTGR